MRVPKFPLRKRLLAPDGFTSVNRVLLLLLFCTGEAVLNLVRGSFYTSMIILYSMSRRMYILYAFLNLARPLLSRLAAYTSHSIINLKGLNRYKALSKYEGKAF